MIKIYTTTLLFLAMYVQCIGQVTTKHISPESFQKLRVSKNRQKIPVIIMPKINLEILKNEDIRDEQLGLPPRFGKANNVNLGFEQGLWEQNETERLWTVKIKSNGAFSINLIFDEFYLPNGAEIYIYNESKDVVIGPITHKQNNNENIFSTDLVKGNSLIIELTEPLSVVGESILHISKVIHGYKNILYSGNGQSSSCNNDINCSQGNNWQDESNAVAMIIVNGNRSCTGALINNNCQDFTPNFLTAFHCLDNLDGVLSQQERDAVQSWVFRFQYKSPSCGGGDDLSYITISGATFRAGSSNSDFALMELNQRPPANSGITYAGWSNSNTAATSGASITHPRGDVMKIALYNNTITQQNFLGSSDWRVVWSDGTVEGGSSGGPLFNESGLIIGQVHGGNPSTICSSTDNAFFGRFDVSWNGGGTNDTRLSTWLTNDPNVTQVNTIITPSISGSSTVCATNSTFNISDISAGQNVSWSVSPPYLVDVASGNGTSAIIKAKNGRSKGQATITFTVNGGTNCPNNATFPKSFWVGKPGGVITTPSGVPALEMSIGQVLTITAIGPNDTPGSDIYSLNWSKTGNNINILSTGPGNSVIEALYLGTGYVYVSASNNCGTGWSNQIPVNVTTGGGGGQQQSIISPNPADNEVNINLKGVFANSKNINADVYLYDNVNEVVFFTQIQESELTIPTNNLSEGLYHLKVITEKKEFQRHIVIKH